MLEFFEKAYKFILVIVGILAVVGIAIVIKHQLNLKDKQDAIEKGMISQKQLDDSITRSSSQYSTKQDLEKFITDNGMKLDSIKKDVASLNSQIVASQRTDVVSTGYKENVKSDSTVPRPVDPKNPPDNLTVKCDGKDLTCPNPDKYNFLKTDQILGINEEFGPLRVPFGEVHFSAWQEKPWTLSVLPRDYKVTTVIAEDENQKMSAYNKVTIIVNNKPYDLEIKDSKLIQQYPDPKFYFFNPKLLLGLSSGLNIGQMQAFLSPGAHVGIMSYGKNKNDSILSVLELGVSYDAVSKNVTGEVTPVAYNLGKLNALPLISNLYVGPCLSFGSNFFVGVGIRSIL